MPGRAGVRRPVPPGGRAGPARLAVPVRRVPPADGGPDAGRRTSSSILVIGSGPIVIGQACEFDYSGTQACKVLRAEGYEVALGELEPGHDHDRPGVRRRHVHRAAHPESVLRSSNASDPTRCCRRWAARPRSTSRSRSPSPGTWTGSASADRRRAWRPSTGPRTAAAFAERCSRPACRSRRAGIAHDARRGRGRRGGDRLPGHRPAVVHARRRRERLARDPDELAASPPGLAASPSAEVLVEESVAGWKEFELEVMRDGADNAVIVCSIENVDPMGVHTGDSITVAPPQTLTDREYQACATPRSPCIRGDRGRDRRLERPVRGRPPRRRTVLIEMNPRVSRSSALASKATGFPIAKIAACSPWATGSTRSERHHRARRRPRSSRPSTTSS